MHTYICTYRLDVNLCVLVFVMCRIVRELMRLARPLPRESVRIALFRSVCESVRLARPLANVFVLDYSTYVCVFRYVYMIVSLCDIHVYWCLWVCASCLTAFLADRQTISS